MLYTANALQVKVLYTFYRGLLLSLYHYIVIWVVVFVRIGNFTEIIKLFAKCAHGKSEIQVGTHGLLLTIRPLRL